MTIHIPFWWLITGAILAAVNFYAQNARAQHLGFDKPIEAYWDQQPNEVYRISYLVEMMVRWLVLWPLEVAKFFSFLPRALRER